MSDTKYIMNQVGEVKSQASTPESTQTKQLPWSHQVLKRVNIKSEHVSPLLQEWLDKKNYELPGITRRPK